MGDLIRTLHEVAHYPAHPPRQPTAEFARNHQAMIDQDVPCSSCGVKHSTLQEPWGSPANPWGAIQMESHHWVYEDSLAKAIDLAYFNEHTAPDMAIHWHDATTYNHPFTQEEMEAWIHGHTHNLVPLCDMCHRHALIGIHAVTYPIWRALKAITPGFDLTGFHAHSPQEAAALTALPHTTGMAIAPDVAAPP